MNEMLQLLSALVAGIVLGLFFYGGLKFTLRKGLGSKNPALWFLLSFLLRTAVVAVGFYFVSGGDWKALLACLAGFTLARFAISSPTIKTEQKRLK